MTAAPDMAPPKSTDLPHLIPRPTPTWSELVASGDFRTVLEAAQARGIDATLHGGSLAELAAFSDAARYSGNHALARRGLLAQRARFPASSEAHAAAFVLGRLSDDEGAQGDALGWYDTYLREAPRGAFAAEASGRKLVSLARAGSTDSSRAAARQYLARYPSGAHAAYARELLSR
jgi:TolA-binding protein